MKRYTWILPVLLLVLGSFAVVRAQEITGLEFPVERVMIAPDEEYQLYPNALPEGTALPQLRYTSSDEKVVEVLPSGVIVGVNGGAATITASTMDGRYSAQCRVTVSYRESSQYSWLILLIELLTALVLVWVFWLSYRRYIRQKQEKELRKTGREP